MLSIQGDPTRRFPIRQIERPTDDLAMQHTLRPDGAKTLCLPGGAFAFSAMPPVKGEHLKTMYTRDTDVRSNF